MAENSAKQRNQVKIILFISYEPDKVTAENHCEEGKESVQKDQIK